jgi:hypothetical protein
LLLNIKAVRSSEKSENFNQTTWRHISEVVSAGRKITIVSCGLFHEAVSVFVEFDELQIGKDLEGNNHGLIEVLSQHSSRGTEE